MFLILLLILNLSVLSFASGNNSPSRPVTKSVIIKNVIIKGNTKTSSLLIRKVIKVNFGDTISLADIKRIKGRLVELGVFNSVNIYLDKTATGNDLFVFVEEGLNILPILSPHLYEKKYGKDEIWYSLSTSIYWSNFRGKKEFFWVSAEGWDKKTLGIGWKQSFTYNLSPYYRWFSASVSSRPSQYFNYNTRQLYANFGIGRKINENIGTYIHSGIYHIRTDSLTEYYKDYNFPKIGFGFTYDNRPSTFPYQKGVNISYSVDNYGLGLAGKDIEFFQSRYSYCSYHNFLGNTFVVSTKGTKRFTKPPHIFRFYGGGEGSVRGYESGNLSGDNKLVGRLEYRFHVWNSYPVNIPYLSYYKPAFSNMSGLIELALFFDSGIYWDTYVPITNVSPEYAYGLGLRFYLPLLKRSAVVDLARNKDQKIKLHLYLDIEF